MKPIIVIIGAVMGICIMIASVYARFDHYGWAENSKPDLESTIVHIDKKRSPIGRYRNSGKISFTFSDGFYYTSYKYLIPMDYAYREIKLPPNVITSSEAKLRNKAMIAHARAIKKLNKQ